MPNYVTYVPDIVLKGCVIPRARPDAARARNRATFQKRYPGHKFVTFYAIAGQSVESIVANFKSSNSPGPALKGLTLPVVVGMSESVKKSGIDIQEYTTK